jgi:hypothetical protein
MSAQGVPQAASKPATKVGELCNVLCGLDPEAPLDPPVTIALDWEPPETTIRLTPVSPSEDTTEGVTQADLDRGAELDEKFGWSEGSDLRVDDRDVFEGTTSHTAADAKRLRAQAAELHAEGSGAPLPDYKERLKARNAEIQALADWIACEANGFLHDDGTPEHGNDIRKAAWLAYRACGGQVGKLVLAANREGNEMSGIRQEMERLEKATQPLPEGEKCERCGGKGWKPNHVPPGRNRPVGQDYLRCTVCRGTGKKPLPEAPRCGGLAEWLRTDAAAEAYAKAKWAFEMPHKPEWVPHAWEMAESLKHARRDLDRLLEALPDCPPEPESVDGEELIPIDEDDRERLREIARLIEVDSRRDDAQRDARFLHRFAERPAASGSPDTQDSDRGLAKARELAALGEVEKALAGATKLVDEKLAAEQQRDRLLEAIGKFKTAHVLGRPSMEGETTWDLLDAAQQIEKEKADAT